MSSIRQEHAMKMIPEHCKVDVKKQAGIYFHVVGMAKTKRGLVCTYRQADQHLVTSSDIMACYSYDGGRTWEGHHSISHLDVENDNAVWIAPELNALPDGRLVIICDKGNRKPDEKHVSLYMWQKPNRGMANYVFWSEDDGITWSAPHKIDDIGGEPERIHQLSNGDLVYTLTFSADRTDNRAYTRIFQATLEPYAYYKCLCMASTDGGQSFHVRSVLADNQLYSDGEVGLVEMAPGRLLAFSRCGDMGGYNGQPTMVRRSQDYGHTWSEPELTPYYGQRVIPGLLQSGKVLITYRNSPTGTSASYAALLNPDEKFKYEPVSTIWDESRCLIEDGIMTVRTDEYVENGVSFVFYPAEDVHARVEIEAELAVLEADINGCNICAGCLIRIEPNRMSLADLPEVGFELDARLFHRYRILREKGNISIFVDGQLRLTHPLDGLDVRMVRIGNKEWFSRNQSVSLWKSIHVKVDNRDDVSIDWDWNAAHGYPDPFRRDRIVCMDKDGSFVHGNHGYSGWTQLDDGTVVIGDYTFGPDMLEDAHTRDKFAPSDKNPFVRAYIVREDDLR